MSKTVRQILIFVLFFSLSIQASAQNRWELSQNGIELCNFAPHSDHLEMSGEQMSVVLRWSIDNNQSFHCERSLVFPMLRTVPNNTHASLRHRTSLDVISLVSVNGQTLQNEAIRRVWIDGYMGVSGDFSIGRSFKSDGSVNRTVNVCRTFFPSTTKPLMGEIYNVTNNSKTPVVLYIPEFSQRVTTLPEKGVTGSYYIETSLQGEGTYTLEPGESLSFSVSFQARRPYENSIVTDLDAEFDNRCNLIGQFDDNLILQTPDPVLDAEFRFAKIRAAESIFKTAGGYLHSPGGEAYYAAIWANDQAEYVNPLFPFLGYGVGNAAALNSYLHFKRFINPDFNPVPSSIIAEGTDIWDGAGDRGDAAMIAYGASRYLLARADKQESEQLWPLVEWCLEYCNRKLNDSGVVASDSDELEGRFPSGDANLCTSCLYYDALLSASMLCKQLGFSYSKSNRYENQARALEKNI